ncbi:MAG: hypothetical protein HY803_05575 [candidate division NC10 bacterium]|nr:hypothetical protein [candidate division NC10 bacterium]
MLVAGGLPVVAAVPDPEHLLRTLEATIQEELTSHFAYLSLPYQVRARLTPEGDLTVRLEITTRGLAHPTEVQELTRGLRPGLVSYLRSNYPRLTLTNQSRVVVKRPFSFTENLPEISATLGAAPAPEPESPARAQASPRPGAAVVPQGPTAQEVAIRQRLGKLLNRRWVVKKLQAWIVDSGQVLVKTRISAISQGADKDRSRLLGITRTLAESLSLMGQLRPASKSSVVFELFSEAGQSQGTLEARCGDRGWAIVGPPARPGSTRTDGAVAGHAAASGAERMAAADRSIPQVNDDPKHERMKPRRPDPYKRPSLPRKPPSYEDLVEVPSSLVDSRGTLRGRVRFHGRRIKTGVYENGRKLNTMAYGESVSISTAKNLQFTFGYTRLHQTDELLDGGTSRGIGNAVTFSLKYQSPPARRRNAHLAVGTDFTLGSRIDRTIRLPDDDKQTESFWAAFDIWTSHLSVLHLMIKRVGLFSRPVEFSQVGLASEWFPHHPLRRAYLEIMFDDRKDKQFGSIGHALRESIYANVGVEAGLGGSSSLIVNSPHVFSTHYQEIQVTVVRKL